MFNDVRMAFFFNMISLRLYILIVVLSSYYGGSRGRDRMVAEISVYHH